MEHYIPHMEHYNIHIEILKKNASRLLYTFFKEMGLLHNLGHWFIFNDSFLRRNKTNYERFIAYIQIDAHLMFLTSFKMNFYTYFPLIPLFKIFYQPTRMYFTPDAEWRLV